RRELATPGAERIWYLGDVFRMGMSVEDAFALSKIDPWFLVQVKELIDIEQSLRGRSLVELSAEEVYGLKRKGFSDKRLALLLNTTEKAVRHYRQGLNIRPVYKRVDTCAAEFATATAYMYSTYEEECEANPSDKKKILVIGGGPNRIGQGIEFDYCCVHA